MTKMLRGFTAAFLACLGFSLPASATTFSTDYTDLWLVPAEAGWGLNLIHQGDTLFASLFVYGGDTLPRWFFASGMTGSATSYSGTLYRAQGTPFSAPWNAGQYSGAISVGSMSLNFNSQSTGTLVYTVDGVTVTKSISRYTFKANNLSGTYIGGMTAGTSNCAVAGNNNSRVLIAGLMTVTHSATGNPSFRVEFTAPGTNPPAPAVCTFTGAYLQEGKPGSIPNGTWSCTGAANNAGTFNMAQIDAKLGGINAVITAQDQYCRYVGYFGGVTDVP